MPNNADATLLLRTRALLQELHGFLTARNEMETPGHFPEHARPNVAAIIRDMQEMNISYAENFAGPVMAIAEAFKERGIEPKGAHSSMMFQHPTNPLGVQEVMAELGYMTEKLELREG